jgi:hypothetical protein
MVKTIESNTYYYWQTFNSTLAFEINFIKASDKTNTRMAAFVKVMQGMSHM